MAPPCFDHPQVWKDALTSKQQVPYMTHNLLGGVLEDCSFCPYEDVMGIGHSGGISTILVPGGCRGRGQGTGAAGGDC